jgi:hypothetical protein
MPFGKKLTASGLLVDFDAVHRDLISPAIEEAGLEPLRVDEEIAGGIIHKPTFEQLILCEYAVADLTIASANVYYELGLRHAVRPASTVLLFAQGTGPHPFDAAALRAMPYPLRPDGKPMETEGARTALVARLREAGNAVADSPVYQLVQGFPGIQRLKTDVFRDQVRYSEEMKSRLATARKNGVEAVRAVERDLLDIAAAEAAVLIDLLLSYRAVKAWNDMIALTGKMSPALAATVMVQEQIGLALNRAGRGEDAERVLLDLIGRGGPSSESYGILGRVYKDRWEAALKAGDSSLARGVLDKAIDSYLRGFEADWRDAYPGINAVTLMELKDPPDPRRAQLIPVVAYAVDRRIAHGKADYWDHATRIELAILAKNEAEAAAALADALACIREPWEPETTARNLHLIRETRERRGEVVAWAMAMEQELERKATP